MIAIAYSQGWIKIPSRKSKTPVVETPAEPVKAEPVAQPKKEEKK